MKISYANKQIVTSLPGKKTYLSQRKIIKKNQLLNWDVTHHDNWTWRPEDQWRKKDSDHQRRATETKGRHSHTIDHGAVFAVSNTFLKMLEPEDKGSERLLPLCPHTFVGLETLIGTYAPTFFKSLEDDLSAGHRCNTASRSWNHLHEVIQKSALATFGRKTSKKCDWYEAKCEKLIPVIVTKHASLAENKRSPIEKTLSAIRSAGSKVQQREQEDGHYSACH